MVREEVAEERTGRRPPGLGDTIAAAALPPPHGASEGL